MSTDLLSGWYDKSNNILIQDLPTLLKISRSKQFGESENEDLVSFLLCQAFESRFDFNTARAYHLAAMIISRL